MLSTVGAAKNRRNSPTIFRFFAIHAALDMRN
jgi:hypothetical protein